MPDGGERVEVDLDVPLAVRQTLGPLRHGRGDPCFRFAADGIWWARSTPDGPVTLHVDDRQTDPLHPGSRVAVTAYGPGAAVALAGIDHVLGLADDPEGLVCDHPAVVAAQRRNPGVRLTRTDDVSEVLVPTILGQKVQSLAAHRSWAALVRAHGAPAPGPAGLVLPPAPDRLASLPYHAYHRFGIERRRADAIRAASRAASRLAGCRHLDAAAARTRLRHLPGIGPWTAATVTGVSHGDPDAVVVGDFNLPGVVAWTLAGERGADDTRMLELLAPFPGQRRRVQRLLAHRGPGRPRRGPRLALDDIRHR